MAIVTTYVCDVTGKSGTERADFVEVKISADEAYKHVHMSSGYAVRNLLIKKLIHKDVAAKLNLLADVPEAKAEPEVSMEAKLKVLLKDYVAELVDSAMEDR